MAQTLKRLISRKEISYIESLRKEMVFNLLESRHLRCVECGGNEAEHIPLTNDGRLFCCAIEDIIECKEDVVTWQEMLDIIDWCGISMRDIENAYKGYVREAVVMRPYEKLVTKPFFYPFPEDLTMVDIPQENMDLMRTRKKIAERFLQEV